MDLSGKRIAILIATGYHEHEFLFPYYRLKEANAEVIVAAPEAGATVLGEGRHGTDGLAFEVETAIGDLKPDELDAFQLSLVDGRWLTPAEADIVGVCGMGVQRPRQRHTPSCIRRSLQLQ